MSGGYVDPREERAHWRRVRVAVEALWLVEIRAQLRKGPALTCDLAKAANVAAGREHSRFIQLLAKHADVVEKRIGASGHTNKVWRLKERRRGT